MTISSASNRWRRALDGAFLAAALALGGAAAGDELPAELAARLQAAAEGGDPAAEVLQARLVLWGGHSGDSTAARDTLERHAKAGDVDAAMALASAYYAGAGLAIDRERALGWWREAADAGRSDAAYNIGLLMLAAGTEIPRALDYLTRAALTQHALACFALGSWFAARPGGSATAAQWLECAARQGYAPAQFNLATLYLRASAPGPDRARARQWYAQAAPFFAPAESALGALADTAPASTRAAGPGDTARPPAPPPAAVDSVLPDQAQAPDSARSVATPPSAATASAPVATTAPASTPDRGAAAIHGIEWVRAQPATHYTLQVAAGSTEEGIRKMLSRHARDAVGAWFLHRPAAREPYSAVIGSYASYDEAAVHLAQLPSVFQRNTPWIRRFGTLQRELASTGDTTE